MEATCTGDYGTDVASHAPEARLKGESLDFRRKTRVSQRSGERDQRPSTKGLKRGSCSYQVKNMIQILFMDGSI